MIEKEKQFFGQFEVSVYQTLWFAYRRYGVSFGLLFLLGFLGRGMLLSTTRVMGQWVDSLVKHPGQTESSTFVTQLIILSLVGFALTLLFRIIFSRRSAQVVSLIYDEVTFRVARYPMLFFDRTPVGRVITRFSSDYGNIFRMFGGPLAEFLNLLFDLSIMLILICVTQYWLTGLVALMGTFSFIIYKLNVRKLRRARRDLSRHRSPAISHFAETAQGATVIRSLGKEDMFQGRFVFLDQKYLAYKRDVIWKALKFGFQLNMVGSLSVVALAWMGHLMIAGGVMSVGQLTTSMGLLVLATQNIQSFFDWMTQFDEALVGVERMDEYLRKPIEPGHFLPTKSKFILHPEQHFRVPVDGLKSATLINDQSDPNRIQKLKNGSDFSPKSLGGIPAIDFQSLSFRYTEAQQWILQDIDLQIQVGEKVGIVGRTGSGKTTLIQCLYALYPLQKGSVALNGKLPRLDFTTQTNSSISLTDFRSQIGFIPQEANLFKGSLRMNLDMANIRQEEELFHVLENVGLESRVVAWGGLDFQIDERGRNISSGERQLICIARCLLQKTPIVVMDEATSQVDPTTEDLLNRRLYEWFKGKTLIIIAHRLSTVEKCDTIVWIDQGQIIKKGTPKEILPVFIQQQNTPAADGKGFIHG